MVSRLKASITHLDAAHDSGGHAWARHTARGPGAARRGAAWRGAARRGAARRRGGARAAISSAGGGLRVLMPRASGDAELMATRATPVAHEVAPSTCRHATRGRLRSWRVAPGSQPSCGYESHPLSLRAARRGERARRGGRAGAQGLGELRHTRRADDISRRARRKIVRCEIPEGIPEDLLLNLRPVFLEYRQTRNTGPVSGIPVRYGIPARYSGIPEVSGIPMEYRAGFLPE